MSDTSDDEDNQPEKDRSLVASCSALLETALKERLGAGGDGLKGNVNSVKRRFQDKNVVSKIIKIAYVRNQVVHDLNTTFEHLEHHLREIALPREHFKNEVSHCYLAILASSGVPRHEALQMLQSHRFLRQAQRTAPKFSPKASQGTSGDSSSAEEYDTAGSESKEEAGTSEEGGEGENPHSQTVMANHELRDTSRTEEEHKARHAQQDTWEPEEESKPENFCRDISHEQADDHSNSHENVYSYVISQDGTYPADLKSESPSIHELYQQDRRSEAEAQMWFPDQLARLVSACGELEFKGLATDKLASQLVEANGDWKKVLGHLLGGRQYQELSLPGNHAATVGLMPSSSGSIKDRSAEVVSDLEQQWVNDDCSAASLQDSSEESAISKQNVLGMALRKASKQDKSKLGKNGSCHICHDHGHFYRVCPVRKATVTCNFCGEKGHVKRECPGIADGGRRQVAGQKAAEQWSTTERAAGQESPPKVRSLPPPSPVVQALLMKAHVQGGDNHGGFADNDDGQGKVRTSCEINDYGNMTNSSARIREDQQSQGAAITQNTSSQFRGSLDHNHNLPEGWKTVHDPSSGFSYYWNQATDEVTWTKPLGAAPPQPPVSQSSAAATSYPTSHPFGEREKFEGKPADRDFLLGQTDGQNEGNSSDGSLQGRFSFERWYAGLRKFPTNDKMVGEIQRRSHNNRCVDIQHSTQTMVVAAATATSSLNKHAGAQKSPGRPKRFEPDGTATERYFVLTDSRPNGINSSNRQEGRPPKGDDTGHSSKQGGVSRTELYHMQVKTNSGPCLEELAATTTNPPAVDWFIAYNDTIGNSIFPCNSRHTAKTYKRNGHSNPKMAAAAASAAAAPGYIQWSYGNTNDDG